MPVSVQGLNECKDKLNVAAVAGRTQALGPGTRAVVWVQGCPFRCKGCLAPDWIPSDPALLLSPEEILERIDLDQITGLTFSGGEPMAQASGLAALARLARRKKDLDVICFTGFRYEQLLIHPPDPGVPELLAEVDVLIDGPFVQQLADVRGLRGSSNQRIIHLTPRLREHGLETQRRKIEMTIRNGEVAFIGIPTPGVLSALTGASLAR